MPQKRIHKCWKNPGEPIGYIENHRGMARLRMGALRRSLGMGFIPANKAEALAILKELQQRHRDDQTAARLGVRLDRPTAAARPVIGRPVTLYQAIQLFREGPYRSLATSNRWAYERAFSYFCTRDCMLDKDRLRALFQERFDAKRSLPAEGKAEGTPLADNTLYKYRGTLSLFFREFVIPNEWLTVDPTATLGKLRRTYGTNLDRPTEEELEGLIADIMANETASDYALYIRFLSITGMR
ncbi:MAG: hypothetical protein ABIQ57_00920, partial [Candidatus Kapaibacterium sp.]